MLTWTGWTRHSTAPGPVTAPLAMPRGDGGARQTHHRGRQLYERERKRRDKVGALWWCNNSNQFASGSLGYQQSSAGVAASHSYLWRASSVVQHEQQRAHRDFAILVGVRMLNGTLHLQSTMRRAPFTTTLSHDRLTCCCSCLGRMSLAASSCRRTASTCPESMLQEIRVTHRSPPIQHMNRTHMKLHFCRSSAALEAARCTSYVIHCREKTR